VREAAAGNRALRFDNLLHHVSLSRLERAYRALRKDAATDLALDQGNKEHPEIIKFPRLFRAFSD